MPRPHDAYRGDIGTLRSQRPDHQVVRARIRRGNDECAGGDREVRDGIEIPLGAPLMHSGVGLKSSLHETDGILGVLVDLIPIFAVVLDVMQQGVRDPMFLRVRARDVAANGLCQCSDRT